MSKFSKNISFEKRRVRWTSTSQTTRVFFATLLTIIIFVLIIGLFTFGMAQIMALA